LKDEAYCGEYTCTTIDNFAIRDLVDELLELGNNWLGNK